MEKGGLTIQPWENENMSMTFYFSMYRVFKKTHVLFRNSTLVNKVNEIFPSQKFLLLLSPPYSLFKRSRCEVIWKLSDLKLHVKGFSFKHPSLSTLHFSLFYTIPEPSENPRRNIGPVKKN